MPYILFAYHEIYSSNAFDEHLLAIGILNGLELSRWYLPMVLLRQRAPSDSHIIMGIDERWYGSSTLLYEDADGTGVLANRADLVSIELPFLGIGEIRAGPKPVSGISTSQQVPSFGGINSVGRYLSVPVVARGRAIF